jgi:hypothetical protein
MYRFAKNSGHRISEGKSLKIDTIYNFEWRPDLYPLGSIRNDLIGTHFGSANL